MQRGDPSGSAPGSVSMAGVCRRVRGAVPRWHDCVDTDSETDTDPDGDSGSGDLLALAPRAYFCRYRRFQAADVVCAVDGGGPPGWMALLKTPQRDVNFCPRSKLQLLSAQ